MLLTKEVEVGLSGTNIKWFEDKEYDIPKYINNRRDWKVKRGSRILVKVEDLPNNSKVLVSVKCDGEGNCNKEIRTPWLVYLKSIAKNNGKYYCHHCSCEFTSKKYIIAMIKKGKSFEQSCVENNRCDLLERWDYDLNVDKNGKTLTPSEITYRSGKKYWFKCLEHPLHKSEQKYIKLTDQTHFNCNQCNTIGVTNPELIKYLSNKEDAYIYSHGSTKKLLMKCPDCGHERKRSPNDLSYLGFACPKCSDGISYPEKFMFNLLSQIKNINKIKDFETEKSFNWLKFKFLDKLQTGRLDFYFVTNSKEYGVETDGSFHSKDNKMNGRTKEESKFIDDEKDRLCLEYDIEVIRIDCEKSEFQYIKNNVLQSKLSSILNFKEEDINWLQCHEAGFSSLVKAVCELWVSGINSTFKISKIVKLSNATVRKYLKQGQQLNWCDYNSNSWLIFKSSKKVICITTNEIFNSTKEASNFYGLDPSSMSKCCSGKKEYHGKLPDGIKLQWMYYEEYLKLQGGELQ